MDSARDPSEEPMNGSGLPSASAHSGNRVTGFSLFLQQAKVLFWKNFILAKRNHVATFLQLAASFFFIFLIYAVDQAVQSRLSTNTFFKNTFSPKANDVSAIPACETGYYIKSPCYDFVWSGNTSDVVVSLVENITRNNPGRPIDKATQTLGFAIPSDVDVWLLNHPYRTPAAFHFFHDPTDGSLSFGLQTNSTPKSKRGVYEDPIFSFQTPMQVAAEREIGRYTAQDWSISWNPSLSEFPHPALATLSIVGQAGPVFLFAAAMFSFVIQTSNLVQEKELKLRQAMNTMGLLESAYWLTWLLWESFLAIFSSLLLVLFGMLFQFDFFLNNDFAVLFPMFFFFSLSMISLAFVVSTFLSKSASANTIGFLIFIVGFVFQLVVVFGFPYDKQFSKGAQIIFSLFPPDLFALGLGYLGDATSTAQDKGIQWDGVDRCPPRNEGCVITMWGIWKWFIAQFVVFFLLAIYCDNTFPDANGVKKPMYYFLLPSYWCGGGGGRVIEGGGCCSCSLGSDPLEESVGTIDEDVAREEERVRGETGSAAGGRTVAVSVQGLVKIFPGSRECGCCKIVRKSAFHAVKGSWFSVEKDKLFCLLGPNGAGKSTTINCLTGIIPTTDGDALIYGRSVRSSSSMAHIRRSMGVCPQFDILWDLLSGDEHLTLFASVKGLAHAEIEGEVSRLLEQVKLTEAAKVRSGSYSGGMKRRLSVALALIGDPDILYLDEPTTGMDPVSRRYVWDIIENSKKGRAIILTTHSMEEADILGDRIAIMAKGRMRCIGTSIHLKKRFGTGFILSLGVAGDKGAREKEGENVEEVKKFVEERLGLSPVGRSGDYLKFLVPRDKESTLGSFFADLKSIRSSHRTLPIVDYQVSLSTLEEVFLNIAKQAELETAQAEGRFDSINVDRVAPLSQFLNGTSNTANAGDEVEIKVPVGAERIFVPLLFLTGSQQELPSSAPPGFAVDITWLQDEEGNLRIAYHSELVPCHSPPPVPRLSASGLNEGSLSRRGANRQLVGIPF